MGFLAGRFENKVYKVYCAMALMTKAEFARTIGVTRQYFSKKEIKDRFAPAMITTPDGKNMIDSDLAKQIIKMTQDPARAHLRKRADAQVWPDEQDPEKKIELSGYEKSRAEREALKVEEARLNLLERKAETLSKTEALRAVASIGAAIREHLQGRNRRIAELASTMTNAREIKAMFDADDRAMLEMISHDFMRRVSTGADGDGQPTIN